MIHFLSDWNFRLVPGVGQLFAAGETILITRKSARPRVLNLFKPLYSEPTSGFVRARRRLERGAAVGIFPEGTVNPDPVRLLRGRRGAAWLSLTTGVPIVPAGIRFPRSSLARRVSEFAPLSLSIGEPMEPPVLGQVPPLVEVRAWHEAIMRRIAALCDKAWHPSNRRDAR